MTHECLCMHKLAFPLPEASWSLDARRRTIFLLTLQMSIAEFTTTGDVLILDVFQPIRKESPFFVDACDPRQSCHRPSQGIVMH